MKPFRIIGCLLGLTWMSAGESVPAEDSTPNPVLPDQSQTVRPPRVPRAWLGLEVSKPDETITAHLPSLPLGMGFVVQGIDKDGPAASAGLQDYDVIWKIGDQMLVNESQLAALLRLSKPGDEIMISGFRAGQPLEVKLKLGVAPINKHPFPEDLVDSALFPGECGGPRWITNVSDKLASYSTEEGRAEVRKVGSVYQVKIVGPNDEPIFDGELPAAGNLEAVPERWHRRIHALRRGLDHALEGRMMPSRQPRPRVVPPVERNP
jgi:hypothetical protein